MKRIIISDEEKNKIRHMHESFKENGRVINEQQSLCSGVVNDLIRRGNESYPKEKLRTSMVKGKVVLNPKGKNQLLTKDMIVNPDDVIQMGEGSEVTFADIKGYGKGNFKCQDNSIKYYVFYD